MAGLAVVEYDTESCQQYPLNAPLVLEVCPSSTSGGDECTIKGMTVKVPPGNHNPNRFQDDLETLRKELNVTVDIIHEDPIFRAASCTVRKEYYDKAMAAVEIIVSRRVETQGLAQQIKPSLQKCGVELLMTCVNSDRRIVYAILSVTDLIRLHSIAASYPGVLAGLGILEIGTMGRDTRFSFRPSRDGPDSVPLDSSTAKFLREMSPPDAVEEILGKADVNYVQVLKEVLQLLESHARRLPFPPPEAWKKMLEELPAAREDAAKKRHQQEEEEEEEERNPLLGRVRARHGRRNAPLVLEGYHSSSSGGDESTIKGMTVHVPPDIPDCIHHHLREWYKVTIREDPIVRAASCTARKEYYDKAMAAVEIRVSTRFETPFSEQEKQGLAQQIKLSLRKCGVELLIRCDNSDIGIVYALLSVTDLIRLFSIAASYPGVLAGLGIREIGTLGRDEPISLWPSPAPPVIVPLDSSTAKLLRDMSPPDAVEEILGEANVDYVDVLERVLQWLEDHGGGPASHNMDPPPAAAKKNQRPDPHRDYDTSCSPRGIALIISNNNFNIPNEPVVCQGTDRDRDDLSELWERLNFQVNVLEDKTADEMRDELRRLATLEGYGDDYNCVVVCILSHGHNTFVVGTDNERVLTEEMVELFSNDRVIASLCQKPKMFFIRACRGGEEEEDPVPASQAAAATGTQHLSATAPGCITGFTINGGSLFIQTLVEVFDDNRNDHDVDAMMTMVMDMCRIRSRGNVEPWKEGSFQMNVFLR